MLKTRKVLSIALVVAMILSVLTIGIVATSAASEGGYYLMGSVNGWQFTDGYKFELNSGADTDGEYVLYNIALTTTDEFKVAYTEDGTTKDDNTAWYPDGMGNNVNDATHSRGQIPEDGNYNIYFRPDGNGGEGWISDVSADNAQSGTLHTGNFFYLEKVSGGSDDPTPTPSGSYCLYGYIEGQDYGKGDEHWQEIGEYVFGSDNTLTATFTQDAYVGVKTTDLQNWYAPSEGGTYENPVTLVKDGAGDMHVDAGTVTFTLSDNGDGTLTLSYTNSATPDPVTEAPAPATTPAVSDKTAIKVDGKEYEVEVGDVVTLTTYLNVKPAYKDGDEKEGWIYNVDASVLYDSSKLSLVTDIDSDTVKVFPVLLSPIYTAADGAVYFNASRGATGYTFDNDNKVLVTLQFKVIADGESEITVPVTKMYARLDSSDDDRFIFENSEYRRSDIAPLSSVQRNVLEVPQHDEPTDPPVTEEPATDAPATEEPATDAPATEEPATDAPITGKSTVTIYDINGAAVTKEVEVGDEITVYAYLNASGLSKDGEGKVASIDARVSYDSDMLTFIEGEDDEMFPNLTGLVTNLDENPMRFNASVANSKNSMVFDEDTDVLAKLTFTVKAEGNSEIKTYLETLSIYEGKDDKTAGTSATLVTYVSEGELVGEGSYVLYESLVAPEHGTEPIETQPDETQPDETQPDETQPDETQPEQPTEEPAPELPSLYVVVDGIVYEVEKDEIITYSYYLVADDKIGTINGTTYYSEDGLEVIFPTDSYGDVDLDTLFPVTGSNTVFNSLPGEIIYNYSSTNGVRFVADSEGNEPKLITVQFKVTADEGGYQINTILSELFALGEVPAENTATQDPNGELEGKTPWGPKPTEPPTEEPEPTEPEKTEASETPEPTTIEPDTTEATSAAETDAETDAATDAETSTSSATAATTASSSTTSNNNPTNTSTVKTGSTELAVLFLMILVAAAGVVMFTRKRKFD